MTVGIYPFALFVVSTIHRRVSVVDRGLAVYWGIGMHRIDRGAWIHHNNRSHLSVLLREWSPGPLWCCTGSCCVIDGCSCYMIDGCSYCVIDG